MVLVWCKLADNQDVPTAGNQTAASENARVALNRGEIVGNPRKSDVGAILLVVVAVAVTIATKGAAAKFAASLGLKTGAVAGVAAGTISATSAAGIAGAAGAAALGSIASQAVGVATGIQDKFSFKGVALAALSAGVNAGSFGHTLATSTAGGIANAATRSAINGDSFERNLIAAIPDILGQAIGGALGRSLSKQIERPQEQIEADPVNEVASPPVEFGITASALPLLAAAAGVPELVPGQLQVEGKVIYVGPANTMEEAFERAARWKAVYTVGQDSVEMPNEIEVLCSDGQLLKEGIYVNSERDIGYYRAGKKIDIRPSLRGGSSMQHLRLESYFLASANMMDAISSRLQKSTTVAETLRALMVTTAAGIRGYRCRFWMIPDVLTPSKILMNG